MRARAAEADAAEAPGGRDARPSGRAGGPAGAHGGAREQLRDAMPGWLKRVDRQQQAALGRRSRRRRRRSRRGQPLAARRAARGCRAARPGGGKARRGGGAGAGRRGAGAARGLRDLAGACMASSREVATLVKTAAAVVAESALCWQKRCAMLSAWRGRKLCRLRDESGMSLEADFVQTDVDTIVFLYKGGKDDSHLTPGGQKWYVNRDGTVSPIAAHHMVLGYGTRTNLAKTCGGKQRLHGGNKDVNDGVLVLVRRVTTGSLAGTDEYDEP